MRPFETIQAPRTLAPNNHARDWTMFGLLALAFLIRATAIIAFPSLHHSDENFQFFEPAHRLAFGTGITAWEFHPAGICSFVPPFFYAFIFPFAEPLVGGPKGYLFFASWCLCYRRWLAWRPYTVWERERVQPTH
jgi:phosphatidylinositol glycan class B